MAKKKGNKRKSGAASAPSNQPSEVVRQLVRDGQTALEDYDYDRAEASFLEATQKEPTAPLPWSALLDLWIGHLGADSRALEIADTIPREARSHFSVASPLALASGRAGDERAALSFVADASERSSGDVYLLLAGHRVKAGDGSEALALFEKAMSFVRAKTPSILQLESQIQGLVQEECKGLEQQLSAAIDSGDLLAAKGLAEQLLGKQSTHSGALKAIALHKAQVIEGEIATLVAQGHGHFEQEHFAQAADSWRQALVLGASAETLGPIILDAESRVKAAQSHGEIEHVQGLLAAGKIEDALLHFGSLEADFRVVLLAEVSDERLKVLESCGLHKGLKWTQAAVRAVLALPAIESLLKQENQVEAAQQLLNEHERVLRRLPIAEPLWHQLSALQSKQREQEVLALQNDLQRALDSSNLAQSKTLLAQLKELGQVATGLQQSRLHDLEEQQRQRQEFDTLMGHERLLQARELAKARVTESGAGTEWQSRLSDVLAAIQKRWKLSYLSNREAQGLSLTDLDLWGEFGRLPMCLSEDGRHFFQAVNRGRWLFVRRLQMPAARVDSAISLFLPEDFDVLTVSESASLLVILSTQGHVLWLNHQSGELERWVTQSAIIQGGYEAVDGAFFARSQHLWIQQRKAYGLGEVAVLRANSLQKVGAVSGPYDFIELQGQSDRVAVINEDRDAQVHEEGGELLYTVRPGRAGSVKELASHPSGRGLIMLMTGVWNDERDDAGSVFWAEASEEGEYQQPVVIEGSQGIAARCVMTSVSQGLTFIVFTSIKGTELMALALKDGVLEQRYRVEAPPATEILANSSGTAVYALSMGEQRPTFVRLDNNPPRFVAPFPKKPAPLPSLQGPFHQCRHEVASQDRASAGFQMGYRQLARKEKGPWLARCRKAYAEAPEQLYALAVSLQEMESTQAAADFLQEVIKDHPDNQSMAFLMGELHGELEQWPQVVGVLEAVQPGEGEPVPRHAFHLLALAHFHLGAFEACLAVLKKGMKSEGRCALSGLHYLAALRAGQAQDVSAPSTPAVQLRLASLVKSLQQADKAQKARRSRDVKAWLLRANIWWSRELQCTARLTEVFLEERGLRPATAAHFEARLAAATYVGLHDDPASANLPLCDNTRSLQELDSLAQRAQGWLQES